MLFNVYKTSYFLLSLYDISALNSHSTYQVDVNDTLSCYVPEKQENDLS